MKTTSTDRPEMRLWLRRPRPPYALLMRRRRSERKRGKREELREWLGRRKARRVSLSPLPAFILLTNPDLFLHHEQLGFEL